MARRGKARQFEARTGMVGLGFARSGAAWRGKARIEEPNLEKMIGGENVDGEL